MDLEGFLDYRSDITCDGLVRASIRYLHENNHFRDGYWPTGLALTPIGIDCQVFGLFGHGRMGLVAAGGRLLASFDHPDGPDGATTYEWECMNMITAADTARTRKKVEHYYCFTYDDREREVTFEFRSQLEARQLATYVTEHCVGKGYFPLMPDIRL